MRMLISQQYTLPYSQNNMSKRSILFIHQNFPGQFKHVSQALAEQGHLVAALAITGAQVPGVKMFQYKPKRGNTPKIHPWVMDMETKVIRGEACMHAMKALKEKGLKPDLIVSHPGWGESMFCKDVFPDTPLLNFIEFYYNAYGADSNFDPEFQNPDLGASAKVRAKNANNLLALDNMDWGLSPTEWQKSTVPDLYKPRIKVIFDGVDTDWIKPDDGAVYENAALGLKLDKSCEVVTFINRNMEPYRGYHQFMRALPKLMRERPKAQVVIVGGDEVSYGAAPPDGQTWKQIFLDEVKDAIDHTRLHYVGRVSHTDLLRLYQISSCHVYLTYPFVLSWSCVEAMAAGCAMVASDTQPVREFIQHGYNGHLVDFFDPDALASQVAGVLANPKAQLGLRANARKTVVDQYDLKKQCLPAQMRFLDRISATKH